MVNMRKQNKKGALKHVETAVCLGKKWKRSVQKDPIFGAYMGRKGKNKQIPADPYVWRKILFVLVT